MPRVAANPGVYRILCTPTGSAYIGSSLDITNRWSKHRIQLRKNVHHCAHLQRAWNKYGEDAFEWHVIQVLPKSGDRLGLRRQLVEAESIHLSALFASGKQLNSSKYAYVVDNQGEKHPLSKLTEKQVCWLKEQFNAGVKPSVLASTLGVSRPTVSDIIHGRCWVTVGPPTRVKAKRMNAELAREIFLRKGQEDALLLANRLGVSRDVVYYVWRGGWAARMKG